MEPSLPFHRRSFLLAVYIDAAEDDEPLTLDFRLPTGLQPRMWEMRIVQLAFEQRAPSGCLQYFEGTNGTLKTLNYLSNGRFIADQDYLLCIRQERGMCGVSYTPCTPDSFRIGPPRMMTIDRNSTNGNGSSVAENSNVNSNRNLTAQNVTDSMNSTDVDVEGSGANPTEQDGGLTGAAYFGQERCRDRVLIPCDFEEFITVVFLVYFCGEEISSCCWV